MKNKIQIQFNIDIIPSDCINNIFNIVQMIPRG